ncbi:helix-turn-helix domain-containing protein [Mariprofundus erugo]|uniref:helix-turn-helix domain-containing protein n=1 Tax=Mariprofundus erugo TaxID=2528639 RepID=UPI0010FF2A1A|nr:helix-turn-helix domain-containing protein [Mariprofundus erugo]TLS78293.1 helix-turn-helix domain-containing protein [Mariprofundus erugo]
MIAVAVADMPAPEAIVRSFMSFERVAAPVLHIHDEDAYAAALDVLTKLLETAPDDPDAPEHGLIELISGSIERYEQTLPEVRVWQAKADAGSSDVALLRLLMDQHGLSGSDFENEIGKKSYVSQILSGEKRLTRNHIERLAARFAISPAMFFG